MKHSNPKMQKRLEGLSDQYLLEHISYFKGTETGDVAKHLLDKRKKKDTVK